MRKRRCRWKNVQKRTVKTKVDTSKRVNEPRMKLSSAKYLPFFVVSGEEGSPLHIYTLHPRIYTRDPDERSEVSHSLLGVDSFQRGRGMIPAFQELSRWPWSVTPVGEHLLPHPPLSPRGFSPSISISRPSLPPPTLFPPGRDLWSS